MYIKVNDEKKLILIFLQIDEDFNVQDIAISDNYAKYKLCVLRSGNQNLVELTKDLIRHNL